MLNLEIVVVNRLENSIIPRQNSLHSLRLSGFSKVYDKMIATASSSTVTLDHLYAKKDELPDESDFFSNSTDFLSTWNSVSAKNWPMFILRGHTYGYISKRSYLWHEFREVKSET